MQHVSREAPGSCAKLSCEYVAEVRAERYCCYYANGCFNTSKFQWIACPDSRAGTRPKRHVVFKFPLLAVMLVPGQQRLTVYCVLHPHPVLQVLWQVQVWRSLVLVWLFLLDPGSLSSATVRGSLFVSAGILDGCLTVEGCRVRWCW